MKKWKKYANEYKKTYAYIYLKGGIKMKKNIILTSIIFLLIGSMVSFALPACPECEVGVVFTDYEAPGCISDGKTTYTCSECSFKQIDVIDALGHDWEPATTCQTVDTCNNCGETGSTGTIHAYLDLEDEDGTVYGKYCALCGFIKYL